MSALARYFKMQGKAVFGYDKTFTDLTEELVAEGIPVTFIDEISEIQKEVISKENVLVIYTPAIPKGNKILNYFISNDFYVVKRAEILGEVSKNTLCLAVAGTHGKTTTSAILGHLLAECNMPVTACLGGIAENYHSNFIYKGSEITVVESDEFDRSFLQLRPDIACVTSMDADHLDIYGDKDHLHESFRLFLHQLHKDGKRIVKVGLPFDTDIRYAVEGPADAYAGNICIKQGEFYFDYIANTERIADVHLGIPGKHNVENAVAAIAVARLLGIPAEKIAKALSSFAGVRRRFEYIVKTDEAIYIDDYAHHPEELSAFLSAVRQLYPTKKLTAIFQPHLYSRTRDFAEGFAAVLSSVDTLLLMEIYPAREMPIKGVDSRMLLEKVTIGDKHIVSPENVKDYVRRMRPELLVTVGAGDIDLLVNPLKDILEHV